MGHTSNAAHASQQIRTNLHSQPSRSTRSSTTHNHVPISPHTATHSTFHRSSRAASSTQCPIRNPLTPSYDLPTYPISTPPPPAFVHSSLDTSGVSCSRTQRQQTMRTRDHINVCDIEGAIPAPLKRGRPASSPGLQDQAAELSVLLRYVRPASVNTTDSAPSFDTSEPFTTHYTSQSVASLPAPTSPPTRPHSSPPASTTTASYFSPYNRFAHSPHVLTPPALPFAEVYQLAVRDPLPGFRYSLDRTSSMVPSNCIPIGGVDASELDGVGGGKRGKGKWKHSKRMKGVPARVECWRVSDGEVERNAAAGGVRRGGEWQRMRVQDIELVSSLSL